MTGILRERLATFLVLVFSLAAFGCSAGKVTQAAEGGVAKFHSQLDSEQYHEIFSQASPEFQKAGPEPELTEFLSAVHRKLGNVKNAQQQSFFINYSTGGTMVTLRYKTEFSNGPADEQFVWRVAQEPVLVSYTINSRALITK